MGNPDELEAYQKGYDDAMRVAGAGHASASRPAVAESLAGAGHASASRPAVAESTRARGGPGAKARRGIGFALGWLVGFPLWFGAAGGFAGLVFGQSLTAFWWGFGGAFAVAFAFALIGGAGALFVRYWPVTLGIVVLVWLGTRLF